MSVDAAIAALRSDVALLRAERDVRALTMRYFRLCDTLGPDTPWDDLGALFTPDAIWEGRGRYRDAFGRHDGRAAIVAMLAAYADPPHFLLNAHYLASEAIEVRGDADATGRWMMLQVSTYRDGRSDFRSAALTRDCRCDDGVWRIARFVTRTVFSRDALPWNDGSAISVPSSTAEESA